MLNTLISKQIIHEIPLGYYSKGQGDYIEKITGISSGSLATFCRNTPKLNHSGTNRYDFLDTVRFMLTNFVCNQLESGVVYKTSHEGWNDFVKHLPDLEQDKKLEFSFIRYTSLKHDESDIFALYCSSHDKDTAEEVLVDEILTGETEVFSFQLSTKQASKLNAINFEIDCDNFDSLLKKSGFSTVIN